MGWLKGARIITEGRIDVAGAVRIRFALTVGGVFFFFFGAQGKATIQLAIAMVSNRLGGT